MKIGLLNAYHHTKGLQTYQTQYEPMAIKYLKHLGEQVSISPYKVAQGEWPSETEEMDLWVITGSPKSSYDNDEWITELKSWVVKAHALKKNILGICFGHQLIAEALGGKVEKANVGWGVGVRNFNIDSKEAWMQPSSESVSLLVSHADQVTGLPKDAKAFGSSGFCKYECFFIGQNILSFQGHPEFTPIYARDRMVARKNILGDKLFNKAKKSSFKPCDHQTIGEWTQQFFKLV
jgi:GMP synthase-like glutamine amidotransferase